MKEILYVEIPTPDTKTVCQWLQQEWQPKLGDKIITPDGIRLQWETTPDENSNHKTTVVVSLIPEISIFVWSVQRTTYLKAFRWSEKPLSGETLILRQLTQSLRDQFPYHYPEPPDVELSEQSIFEALAPYYPQTVHFFRKMPRGEYDLNRVYWWEKRWREGVRNPQQPKQVLFKELKVESSQQLKVGQLQVEGSQQLKVGQLQVEGSQNNLGQKATLREQPSNLQPTNRQPSTSKYDVIYIGGALGVIHAATMAQRGYRVLLIERLTFGRMNREWNISRDEFQSLIDLGLFTPTEFEGIIAREYVDGFNKFFDSNNPPHLKAAILHTPRVLNIAIDSAKFLQLCGKKLKSAGGEIWDETEFIQATITPEEVVVDLQHLPTKSHRQVSGRLLVDAMGTASPIAWQLNGGRAFNSVCPTVGAVIEGFEPQVWDPDYGDVLNSHGDISRGRQLIWELFPGAGEELTIYLFHYHQIHPENPGSLLEMYEDFFTILPEYRRCDIEKLVWKKPTFGYIPGHFTVGSRDRIVAFDRLLAIGDAASLQSPLVFTGFGSLVRNLYRLTDLLDTALRHNLLSVKDLNQIRAYQSNIAVTWLFSQGMMVPTGRHLPPQRINAMLNTFFGLLADEPPEVPDTFIKDRFSWLTFNRLALKAARRNPALIPWILEMAGAKDFLLWVGSYLSFTSNAFVSGLLKGWFPSLVRRLQPWLEKRYPRLWLQLLAQSYAITAGMGRPEKVNRELKFD
ncbi:MULTISPECIES: flavin-dependent dehydrogenase [unclassified Moorena]|uniref:NAD(P)/FAD-dependent oxidoreductase n=1 Tax=unclassified Moorena TaxID=2683338 RepID=UPI0013FF246C|nr:MULTISPECIES: flavin-dependent dehydrogenase [unclassified Moorena]NEO10871.1 flavin-dependent dehydrogenase [Moorena sp. SIO3E8]NEP97438.1 flavin-dependent dehydrogenase [Moorena sp. SIO3F7]